MGNSARRSSLTRSFFERSSTAESSFKRSPALESKLAPQKFSNANDRDAECPICFLSFETFNTTTCCKQHVCTECYFQVKQSTTAAACPFCGVAGFVVQYIATPTEHSTSPSCKSIEQEEAKEPSPVSTAGVKVSSPASCSYLTPEQDRKLRSTSFDSTAASSNSVTATKQDREDLEQQIRSQRERSHVLNYDDDFMSPYRSSSYSSSSTRSNSSSAGGGGSGGYFHRNDRLSPGTVGSSNNNEYNTWSIRRRGELPPQPPPQAQQQPVRMIGRRRIAGSAPDPQQSSAMQSPPPFPPRRPTTMTSPAAEEQGNDEEVEDRDEGEALIASLQSLLNGHALQRVPSLEQLEELMLMEAIRQSMQESAAVPLSAPSDPDITAAVTNNEVAIPAPAAPMPAQAVVEEESKAEHDEDGDLLQ